MNQEQRGQILSAAVRELSEDQAEPEEPAVSPEEPEAEVEVEAEDAETVAEATPDPRIPKRRLDEEIRKKREAEDQAAYWKGRAEASVTQPQSQPSQDEDDEDDILSRLDRRLQNMEIQQQRSDQRRALEEETTKLKAEINSAMVDAPLAKAEDVAREMLLDPRMSAVEAAHNVHDRENQREAEILKKHSIAKKKKGDAARRPKTTGSPVIAAEEKQPRTRDNARRAFADAFNRLKDQGRGQ